MTMQDPDYLICEILLCLHALPRIAFFLPRVLVINVTSLRMWRLAWKPGGIHSPEQISVFSGRQLSCKGALHPLNNPEGRELLSHSLWPALKRGRDERRKETHFCHEKMERGAWAWNAPECICSLVVCHYIGLSDQRCLWWVQLYRDSSS